MKSTLEPLLPGEPALTASVTVVTPEVSGEGPLFSVRYEIAVSSIDPVFSVGRIAGGSTAWAFDLEAPTVIDGTIFYIGTTGMADFQIAEMLANRTDFEVYAYTLDGDFLNKIAGPLVAVPEPPGWVLVTASAALLAFKRRKPTGPCTRS
ncbi:hypothetical protein GC207_13620 [bacterium]|nr:hypothetical protein [bacterium]